MEQQHTDFFTSTSSVTSKRVIATPSAFAKASLLSLQETGTLKALAPHTSSRVGLDSYLFFMVLSGRGSLNYGGVRYELSAGDCVFIDCSIPYSHTTDKELWSLAWVHFTGPQMAAIYDKYKARGGQVVFHPGNLSAYRQIYEALYEKAGSDSYVRDMEINSALASLLVLLMEDSWNPESGEVKGKRVQVIAIREYLDTHFAENITLDALAEAFYINKTYLAEMFKEQYGVPVKDYLSTVRITEAKKLLRFTDRPMDEIAEAVGVHGGAYFSRMFKRIEGVNPSEYRNLW